MYASNVKRNSVCHYLRRTKGNSLIKIVWHTVFTQRLWEVKKLCTLSAHRMLFFFRWCCLEVEVWQLSDSFYPAAAAPACQPRSHRIRTISPLFIFVSWQVYLTAGAVDENLLNLKTCRDGVTNETLSFWKNMISCKETWMIFSVVNQLTVKHLGTVIYMANSASFIGKMTHFFLTIRRNFSINSAMKKLQKL